MSLFKNMSWRNKLAFSFFVCAKIMGMVGVLMGFVQAYRAIGANLLIGAFVCIGCCLGLALFELFRQNKNIPKEEELASQLAKELKITKGKAREVMLLTKNYLK